MKFRVYTFRSAVCKPTSNCIGPSLKPSDMYRSCWQAVGPFAKQQQVCKVPCNKQAMPLNGATERSGTCASKPYEGLSLYME